MGIKLINLIGRRTSMGLKKIKCKVKAGRGDGEDHLWNNFLEEAYDDFKAAYDAADADTKTSIVDRFNAIADDFGTEMVSNKANATNMWADIDEPDQCKVIDALFGRNGQEAVLEEEAA